MSETLEQRLFELAKVYKKIEKSMEETEKIYGYVIKYQKIFPLGEYTDEKFMKMESNIYKYLNKIYKK